MLLRSWDSGAEVRVECVFAGASASFVLFTADEDAATALRAHATRVGRECARRCESGRARRGDDVLARARFSCVGPAARPLVPAA
jgi:hypothetical protein